MLLRMARRSKNFAWADVATWAGTLFTIATANWVVIVSVCIALWAGLSKSAFTFLTEPHHQLMGQVFVGTLWTLIGLYFLYKIHTGIRTQPHIDYAFGLLIENVGLAVDQTADGNIQPNLQLRNMVNSAIRLSITDVRVIIDGKANPDITLPTIVIPRLGQKGVGAGLFKKEDIAGKLKVEGSLDISFEYGPHDGEPVRKLRLKLKLHIQPPANGQGL